jgi:hypothetical protein
MPQNTKLATKSRLGEKLSFPGVPDFSHFWSEEFPTFRNRKVGNFNFSIPKLPNFRTFQKRYSLGLGCLQAVHCGAPQQDGS